MPQDHLGWGKVHLVGHSMGAMIAAKLAVLAPHRVESLLLVSPTGGGFQAVPRSFASFKICLQVHSAFLYTSMKGIFLPRTPHKYKASFRSFSPIQ